jgi:hypothetical protein
MPDGRPVILAVVPVPVVTIVPGYLIRVQVPTDGKPENNTDPVDKIHVGVVIVPTEGAAGVGG